MALRSRGLASGAVRRLQEAYATRRGTLLGQRFAGERSPPALCRQVSVYVMRQKAQEEQFVGANAVLSPQHESKRLAKRASRAGQMKRPASATALREVTALVREQRYVEALKAFKVVEDPDPMLCSAALDACAKGFLFEEALHIWEGLRPEERCHVSYTTMIDLHRRVKNVRGAEVLFEEMKAARVKLGLITYNTMISLYSAGGLPERAVGMLDALRASAHWAEATATNKQISFCSAMSATARAGDYAGTRALFVQMQEEGVPANNMIANALLTSCAGRGDAETAQAIFEMFPAWNLLPRLEDYVILMACCRFDLARCRDIFDEILRAGLTPNGRAHQVLLEAYVLAGDGPGARAALERGGPMLDHSSKMVRYLVKQMEGLLGVRRAALAA